MQLRKNEDAECIAFNNYLVLLTTRRVPDFIYTFSGNGGKRHITTAIRLKRMGLKAGVWDYYFRKAGLPTHWIEMKYGKNGLTKEQTEWREELSAMGDTFAIHYSAEDALRDLIRRGFVDGSHCNFVGATCFIKV